MRLSATSSKKSRWAYEQLEELITELCPEGWNLNHLKLVIFFETWLTGKSKDDFSQMEMHTFITYKRKRTLH